MFTRTMLSRIFGIVLLYPMGCVIAVCNVDIVYLVDTSGSIGTSNFLKVKEFIANSLNNFQIGLDGTRVSVVTFSTNIHDVFHLSTYDGKASLLRGINKIPYDGYQSFTGKGLQYVREKSFTSAYGDRQDVKNVLVLITDGHPTDPSITAEEFKLLAQTFPDMTVVAIAIGRFSFGTRFINIPLNSSVTIPISGFDLLSNFGNRIHTIACGDKCTDIFPTCQNANHGKVVCTSHSAWSAVNCASYCGICPGKCEDVATDCRRRGLRYCSPNSNYMAYNCRKFCGYCNETTTSTSPPTTATTTPANVTPHIIPAGGCTDRLTNCYQYGSTMCNVYKQWSIQNCANFCRYCHEVKTTTHSTLLEPLQPIIG